MFRFTIRDLLWLTLVVALAAAWWMDRGRLTNYLVDCRRTMQEDKARYLSQLNQFARRVALERLRERAPAPNPPSE
jgi:hypothetical protein